MLGDKAAYLFELPRVEELRAAAEQWLAEIGGEWAEARVRYIHVVERDRDSSGIEIANELGDCAREAVDLRRAHGMRVEVAVEGAPQQGQVDIDVFGRRRQEALHPMAARFVDRGAPA